MKKLSTFLITVLSFTISNAQEWHWEYAKFVNRIPFAVTLTEPLHIDLMHNTFIATRFDTLLLYSDTSFHQAPPQHEYQNIAISKHDVHGQFVKGIKLIAKYGTEIHEPMVATDSQLNIYLTMTFRDTLIINGLTIPPSFAPESPSPRLLVAKFDPSFNLLWHGLIESPYQEMNNGLLVTPEDEVYLAVLHARSSGGQPYQVSFLGQDTSEVHIRQLTSLLKLNTDGELIWRKEIEHSNLSGSNQGRQCLSRGDDSDIKLFYNIRGDLFIGSDTLYFPEMAVYPGHGSVLLTFNTYGSLINYELLAHGWILEKAIIHEENIFFVGNIYDSPISFAYDTIYPPDNNSYRFIGKLDHERRLQWHHLFKSFGSLNSIKGFGFINDKLLFSITSERNIQIIDTLLQWPGATTNTVIVELDTDGNLSGLMSSHAA